MDNYFQRESLIIMLTAHRTNVASLWPPAPCPLLRGGRQHNQQISLPRGRKGTFYLIVFLYTCVHLVTELQTLCPPFPQFFSKSL